MHCQKYHFSPVCGKSKDYHNPVFFQNCKWSPRALSCAMDKVVLPDEVTTFFQDWKARGRNLKILVIGDCYSGKTTLVNNLLGEEIAQDHAPSILSTFHGMFQGVPVTVYETSGLENPDAENDAGCMNELRALLSGGEVDVIIYCFKATETRMRESLSRTFKVYHSMGLDWRKTVIALTIADALPILNKSRQADSFNKADCFNECMDNWRDEIKRALIEHAGASSEEVKAIQIAPTQDDVGQHLPNDDPWYEPFWLRLLMCLKVAQLPSSTNVAHQLSVQHVTEPTDSEPIQTPPASTTDDEPVQTPPPSTDDGEKIQTRASANNPKNECSLCTCSWFGRLCCCGACKGASC